MVMIPLRLCRRMVPCGYSRYIGTELAWNRIMNSHETLEQMRRGDVMFIGNRIRQHANPLSSPFQVPLDIEAQNILGELSNAQLNPMVIDIGCGKGQWLFRMAASNPNANFLGLELRVSATQLCLQRKLSAKVPNVYCLNANANVDLDNLLRYLSSHQVNVCMIAVQFPDPHFKTRTQKRRVVDRKLLDAIARHGKWGLKVFVQSDVLEVQQSMVNQLSSSAYFSSSDGYSVDGMESNPSAVVHPTDRELSVLAQGLPVYRMLFERNQTPYAECKVSETA